LGAIVQENGAEQFFTITGNSLSRQAFTEFFIIEFLTLRNGWDGTAGVGSHLFCANDTTPDLNVYYQRGGKLTTYNPTDNAVVDTSAILHSSRLLVVLVGDTSASSWVVNGTTITRAAIASGSCTLSNILGYSVAGLSTNCAIYDFGYYNKALGSTDLTTLYTWAQTRGVQSTYSSNTVFDGDSLTVGGGANIGQTMNRNYSAQMNIPLTHRRTLIAEGGLPLSTMASEAATLCDPWIVGGITNICLAWGGTNDFALNGNSVATVTANAVSYCNARHSVFTKVGFMTMLPRPASHTFSDANLASFNTNLRNDHDNSSLQTDFLVELDQDPSIGGTDGGGSGNNYNATYYCSDHIHLNDVGESVVANLVYPFYAPLVGLQSYSYSVSGPGVGTTNIATTNFTVALAGTCTFNGTQSIKITCPANVTCTATASGGTITNNNTGMVTVRPAPGQEGFTYTLTSTTTGAKAIQFNGYSGGTATPVNRGWTDSVNDSVTFSAPPNPPSNPTPTGDTAEEFLYAYGQYW
jgi:hypothetical protein